MTLNNNKCIFMKKSIIIFILLLLGIGYYIHQWDPLILAYGVTNNKNIYAQAAIEDLINIPQNSTALSSNFSNRSMASFDSYFLAYFAPWDQEQNFVSSNLPTIMTARPKYYLENYQAVSDEFYAAMEQNSNVEALNTVNQKAIVINNTNLRVYPTNSYLFANPNSPGEGYPFDYAQNDFLKIGEPILISHYTKDGVFAYVKTSSKSNGFILAVDLVTVDNKFITKYKKHLVMLTENTTGHLIENPTQHVALQLYMGTILPLLTKNTLLIPVRTIAGKAALKTVSLPANTFIEKPLAFSKDNVARIVDNLIGTPYGWGGSLFHFDCAGMVRNYFAPFGIYMPLGSWNQAKQGAIVELRNMNNAEKKNTILSQATPYQSIIYLPGHIGVYMGEYNGEPIMLHAAWGVGLYDNNKTEYRYVIGKTVITTLSPGKELPGFDPTESNKLHRITHAANIF